jgi:hypothetical protein
VVFSERAIPNNPSKTGHLQRKVGHCDPNQAFFNRETDYVVATTCHVASRTSHVAARTRLVAARTNLVGGTTCHVAGRTKHVATRTCHVASRTKLVAARTNLVVAPTKPVAARTLSSFDGISMERGAWSLNLPSAATTILPQHASPTLTRGQLGNNP